MNQVTKYTSRISLVALVVFTTVGIAFSFGSSLGKQETGYSAAVPPPGDDTTTVFPIPQTTNPYDPKPTGGLYMKDPPNMKTELEYDPVTNEYTIKRKIGNFDYLNPASFSFDEYKNWDLKRAVDSYWAERSKTTAKSAQEGIIPQIKLDFLEPIFGSNTIDIRLQGRAELTFQYLHNRRNDPSLPERQRKQGNFDFASNIQLNALAKIGDKIEFNMNYSSAASFDFENKTKLKYEGKEDEIIKLVEAGDVTLPLNSSLINGSQSLFGLKTQLQFGKATVTAVFSQQRSQMENMTFQGGAQTTKYKVAALDYEENRHFFLAQYHRNNFEQGLAKLPIVSSNINITKIEVWITNIGAPVYENRTIVGFQDLGENDPYNKTVLPVAGGTYPSNNSNTLLKNLDTSYIRNKNLVNEYLTQKGFTPGVDFEKIELARKLRADEFSFNSRLGFISLNTYLNADQTLAVAYQYTVIGSDKVYQVGEFSDAGIPVNSTLIVKLLKSSATNTRIPMWNLMMKNVYNIGAYQLNKEDFILNILYSGNDNAVPTGYFTEGPDGVKGVPLLQLMGLDNLDQQMNPPHDGIFDFIDNAPTQGGTISTKNGRVYFTVLEPFGSYLRQKIGDKSLADRYCYDSLYTLTKTGAQQYPEKNKYTIEGQYKSETGSEYHLNANNIPQGSVKVRAGGIELTENVDYTVDYLMGTVKIINPGILNSGTPINISLENNANFNLYNQTMLGAHLDYKVNNDLLIGATIMNMYERPLTQKTNYGDEPINNVIWGASVNYQKDVSWITKIVNKVIYSNSATPSKLRFDGEFAHFIPGHSRSVGKAGTSFIDDFEGAKTSINLQSITTWSVASTPQGQTSRDMFPEGAPGTGLIYGYNRARLSWYYIDDLFYGSSGSTRRPGNISVDEVSKNSTRIVYEKELFPEKSIENNRPSILPVFNLAYFPDERGPYNYDVEPTSYSEGIAPSGRLNEPSSRWAGIMRKMDNPDFERANIEYITFWLMDPFDEDPSQRGGDLYFQLGDISEDILRDGRKSFENGFPTSEVVKDVDTTIWGRVPSRQALTNSFDNNADSRKYQDIGYDGLSTEDERSFFANYLRRIDSLFNGTNTDAYRNAFDDPGSDDFHYYLGGDYDNDPTYSSVIERYKKYTNPEGNSPVGTSQGFTLNPNVEDINNDNTLSDQERYFQYRLQLRPEKMIVGENYITDMYTAMDVELENGKKRNVKWYQFKIPIQQPTKVVGSIQDFRSVRFMRMLVKNFETPIVCRFATFELERGEWRKYNNSLLAPGEYVPDPGNNTTTFDISTVNIEENSQRANVPYVLPPGVDREQLVGSTSYIAQNEQSMVLKVCNLLDGDARGAYKTTDYDFRNYKRLKMYIHAEKSIANQELKKGDLTVFIRFGSDFTNNYYEYEVPLEFTPWGTYGASDANAIWPDANMIDLDLEELVNTKLERGSTNTTLPWVTVENGKKTTILGMPSLSDVRVFMIGVRNPKYTGGQSDDDGQPKCAEIWVNELRLTNFKENSAFAATGRLSTTLSDLGNIVLAGSYSTAGFGSIEEKINQRQKESIQQIDVATNLELGKFLPENVGLRLPLHYDYTQTVMNPEYNPLDPDVKYSKQLDNLQKSQRDSLRERTQDVVQRQSINFMNVRKERVAGSPKKVYPWDIENFNVSYSYSEIKKHNVDVESDKTKSYNGALGYMFAISPKVVKPFKSATKLPALINDFNFYYLPESFSFQTDMRRDYQRRMLRNKSDALIILEPTYMKRWDWTRSYDLQYKIAQSIRFKYNARMDAYIDEPSGGVDKGSSAYRDTVWNSIRSFGSPNNFTQTYSINYILPFNKVKALDWFTGTAQYGAAYRWVASPKSVQSQLGNTIDNSREMGFSGSATLTKLYDKVGFLKKATQDLQKMGTDQGQRGQQRTADTQKQGLSNTAAKNPQDTVPKPKPNYLKIASTYFLGVLMSVKDLSFTYNQSNTISLPGFMPEPGLLGNDWNNTQAPGFGFILGSQKDIRQKAAQRGWLTTDSLLNNPYIVNAQNAFQLRSNVEPIKNLKITVNFDRTYRKGSQELFTVDAFGNINSSIPQETGSFTISYFMWPTAFAKTYSDYSNKAFTTMLDNRIVVANRLASQNPNYTGERDSLGFPVGYSNTQAQVLLGSFLSGYSGRDASSMNLSPFKKIPLPNWNLTYNLHQGIKSLQKNFQSVTLRHNYRSTYTIGSFISDINYKAINGYPSERDEINDFIPYQRMDVVVLSEQFSPLIGVDMTLKNSMKIVLEYKKTRTLTLSFVNNQITELGSSEYVTGFGYRFKNVPFRILSLDPTKKAKKISSDLNIRADFSIMDNITLLRSIEDNHTEVSAGFKKYTINLSADYVLSAIISARAFVQTSINRPQIQVSTSNTAAGITLSFLLAQ